MASAEKQRRPWWLYATGGLSLIILFAVSYSVTLGFEWWPLLSGWLGIATVAFGGLGATFIAFQNHSNHKETLATTQQSKGAERDLHRESQQAQLADRRSAEQERRVRSIRDGHAVTLALAQQLIDAVMRYSGCLEDLSELQKFTVDGVSQPVDMEGLLKELNAQPLKDLGQSAAEAKALRHACKEMLDTYRDAQVAAQTHRDRGEDFEPWKGKFIGEARHGTFGAREALAALIARRDRSIEEARSEPA